jgi:glycosyltransferase involved in cell wall biosynthesis
LWVTDEPPDRNGGGGNIRQAMLLGVLREHFAITLLVVGELDDDVTRAQVDAVLELPRPRQRRPGNRVQRRAHDLGRALVERKPAEITESAPVHRALKPVLRRIADDHDVVVVQHLGLAPVLPRTRRGQWVLEVHNVPSERARQELANEPGGRQRWLLRRNLANAQRSERDVARRYDHLVFVSDADAGTIAGPERQHARGTVVVAPNGVDTTTFVPSPLPAAPNLLFTGTLDYRPNVLGALWFAADVLPKVRAAVPSVRLALVGRRPLPEVLALQEHDGVEVHADVPAMAPWLAWGRVVVVPLHIGTGTRLKALEALAAGRPMVGTTIGLEGLDLVDGVHARIVDDPAVMADAIVRLLTADDEATALAAAGRAHVEANFTWDAIGARLAAALTTIVHAAPRPVRDSVPKIGGT